MKHLLSTFRISAAIALLASLAIAAPEHENAGKDDLKNGGIWPDNKAIHIA